MISLEGKDYIFWSYQVFPLVKELTTNHLNFSAFKENCGTIEHSFYVYISVAFV